MTDNSILNMVGGEKHINPHYDIKEESANKGFTGIEVNGVRFSNIQEMLVYMDKQRNEIILLEKENVELKEQIEKMKCCQNCKFDDFMEEPCCNCSRCFGDIKREGYSDKWEIN